MPKTPAQKAARKRQQKARKERKRMARKMDGAPHTGFHGHSVKSFLLGDRENYD